MDRCRCILSGRNYLLHFFILASCSCASTCAVNVTQSSYQVEENHNITLEWSFIKEPDSSLRNLSIHCYKPINKIVLVSCKVNDGIEVPESQDKQFAGRVQLNKDVLREGRLRLHVSRLRTEDSGLYRCDVRTDHGFSFKEYQLDVFPTETLAVNATQSFYQLEENDNITLEFTFTPKTDCSSNILHIMCYLLTKLGVSVLYQFYEGVEVSESQDEQFAGRVHGDKDVLREGRIRVNMSRLRIDDSGLYRCEVTMGNCFGKGSSTLNVTAMSHPTLPHQPTTPPPSEDWGRTGLYVGLSAAVVVLLLFFGILGIYYSNRQKRQIQSERIPLRTKWTRPAT